MESTSAFDSIYLFYLTFLDLISYDSFVFDLTDSEKFAPANLINLYLIGLCLLVGLSVGLSSQSQLFTPGISALTNLWMTLSTISSKRCLSDYY